jgi:hypothetical protein
VQHHRAFEVARMHAVLALVRGEQALGQAQRVPVGGDDHHVVLLAQVARHDVHHAHLAAVAVVEHQLAHAGLGDAGADVLPQRDQRVGRHGQRARVARMLVALAVGHGGQEQHRQVVGQVRERGAHHAVDGGGVGRHRQVRTVLLGGAHRQHGDEPFAVEAGELFAGQVGPEAAAQCGRIHRGVPRDATAG